MLGGHYVAYAKNEDTNMWLEYNDSMVSMGMYIAMYCIILARKMFAKSFI